MNGPVPYSLASSYRYILAIRLLRPSLTLSFSLSHHPTMTDRHVFNDHTTLVLRSLKGLVASHPYLALVPSLKVVYRADHNSSKVSLICGGGSGHEPGTSGHVGRGLLSASACGDVFASPSARQVFGAVKMVPSDKGTILIITNCELLCVAVVGNGLVIVVTKILVCRAELGGADEENSTGRSRMRRVIPDARMRKTIRGQPHRANQYSANRRYRRQPSFRSCKAHGPIGGTGEHRARGSRRRRERPSFSRKHGRSTLSGGHYAR